MKLVYEIWLESGVRTDCLGFENLKLKKQVTENFRTSEIPRRARRVREMEESVSYHFLQKIPIDASPLPQKRATVSVMLCTNRATALCWGYAEFN